MRSLRHPPHRRERPPCIGYVDDYFELAESVRRAAVGSAFHDNRFRPVTAGEIDAVRIEISVLSPLRRVDEVGCVRPGLDGVMIRRGHRSGLLLPQVATEQGWGRTELLEHACLKAGLPKEAYLDPTTTVEVFTAIVFGEID